MGLFRDLLYGIADLVTGADPSNNSVSSEDIENKETEIINSNGIELKTCMNCKFLKKDGSIYYCSYDQDYLNTPNVEEIGSAKCEGKCWRPRETISKYGYSSVCPNPYYWDNNYRN